MQIMEVTYTELRKNLATYLERVQEGVVVKVTRRPSNQGEMTAFLVAEKDVASLADTTPK